MKFALNSLRTYWLSLLFAALSIALLAIVYHRLPDPLPLLWTGDGAALHSMAKPAGPVLLPLAQLLMTIFLIVAPAVDPGSLRAPQAPRFYPLAVAIISGFLTFITGLIFAAALEFPLSMPHALFGGVGVLFALVGNYLGKIPKNYMVGIRTPWTLSSDYVWERTHRFAAPVFVVGGAALILYCFLGTDHLDVYIALSVIAITVLAPYFYSYLAWKRTRPSSGA